MSVDGSGCKDCKRVREHVASILPFTVLEAMSDKPLRIRGVAMCTGMSRNLNIYMSEELQNLKQLTNTPARHTGGTAWSELIDRNIIVVMSITEVMNRFPLGAGAVGYRYAEGTITKQEEATDHQLEVLGQELKRLIKSEATV